MENYPLKKFKVSYDLVEKKPLLSPYPFGGGFARKTEIVEATRFKDAAEIVKVRLMGEGYKRTQYKNFEVEMLKDYEEFGEVVEGPDQLIFDDDFEE